jgi:hypothetical protein
MRTTEKGLYHVKGSMCHTLYDEQCNVVSGGCDGEIELYYLANNIYDVIQRIKNTYTYKDGNRDYSLNITYIKEETFQEIQDK